ncbi:MAG TPA: glycoside hydrolase family 99-like domain-containing protein [Opitutaceae bacterium]|nr:glycoside hydrolase family 99-like domain-containing protein [Opitutaceae bacterium]
MRNPKALAFYLPQFHPVPENDEWWGKGFTEWRNVVKTRPRFSGHYQPHLPADLGFYDLRLPEVQAAQVALAQRYGIHGFCYYHYWFHGKRILERPVEQLLRLGKPDFPFCLCWANESWNRRWDGCETEILMEQRYSPEDDERHLHALLPAFKDPRYIKIDGRPMFLVYRPLNLPNAPETLRRWRQLAEAAGLPGLYLVNVESIFREQGVTLDYGFDAAVEFAPDWSKLPTPRGRWRRPRLERWRRKLALGNPIYWRDRIYDYELLVRHMLDKPTPPYLRFPGVTPSWDNSARRASDAVILRGASPERYQEWLRTVVERFEPPSADEDFVFINAWNEWAEGNHLEPCVRYGHRYLEATRDAIEQARAATALRVA